MKTKKFNRQKVGKSKFVQPRNVSATTNNSTVKKIRHHKYPITNLHKKTGTPTLQKTKFWKAMSTFSTVLELLKNTIAKVTEIVTMMRVFASTLNNT